MVRIDTDMTLASVVNFNDRDINVLTDFRSEEHTSELQSHVRISYAVFCLKKKKKKKIKKKKTKKNKKKKTK